MSVVATREAGILLLGLEPGRWWKTGACAGTESRRRLERAEDRPMNWKRIWCWLLLGHRRPLRRITSSQRQCSRCGYTWAQ